MSTHIVNPSGQSADSQLRMANPLVRPRRALRPRRPQHATLVLTVILTTQLMVILDGTIVNVALPYIQRSLTLSTTSLSWVISGYTLTFGGLLLFGARCGDLLGRRRTFLAGIAIFSIGSLAGGFAADSSMLLAARALQGIGGAFAAPATLALLTALFPEGRERIRAIGLFTAVSVGGAASGLVAGGLLIHVASWRWVFFVNVPIGAIVYAIARVVLPETPRTTGRFDVTGALTSTVGMGGLVFGFVEAGSDGWGSPVTLGAFVAGIVLLAAFARTEAQAEQPILPLRLLQDRTRTGANVARGLLYAGAYGMFFFLTQYLQDVRGYSALRTGFAFLPIPLMVFTSSQLTAKVLMARFPAKRIMLIGISLSTLAIFLLSRVGAHASYPQLLLSMVLFGIGNGLSFVTLTGASLAGVDARDAGAASGLVNVMQQIGPAIGVAVLATIFEGATAHSGVGHTSNAVFTHGVDQVFLASTVFLIAALGLVVAAVPQSRSARG